MLLINQKSVSASETGDSDAYSNYSLSDASYSYTSDRISSFDGFNVCIEWTTKRIFDHRVRKRDAVEQKNKGRRAIRMEKNKIKLHCYEI